MGDDDDTPVRRISSTALNLGALAAEDLINHLQRCGVDIEEAPAGFVERVAFWLSKGEATKQALRRERDSLRERLEAVELERNALANKMRTED